MTPAVSNDRAPALQGGEVERCLRGVPHAAQSQGSHDETSSRLPDCDRQGGLPRPKPDHGYRCDQDRGGNREAQEHQGGRRNPRGVRELAKDRHGAEARGGDEDEHRTHATSVRHANHQIQ